MDRIEQKREAMAKVQAILMNRSEKDGALTIAEHILDVLEVNGWRGPQEVQWIKSMVFDQARMADGPNPYKKEEASVES